MTYRVICRRTTAGGKEKEIAFLDTTDKAYAERVLHNLLRAWVKAELVEVSG